jgi:hypothetical protein
VCCDVLQLCKESHPIRTHRMQISEERVLVPSEPEHTQWDRDPDIHPYHSHVSSPCEIPVILATLGVDHGAVGEFVSVHEGQAFLVVFDPFDAKYRPKDLLVSYRHPRFHMVK